MKNFSLLRTPFQRFLPCFLFVFFLLYAALASLRILACTSTINFLKHSTFLIVSSLLITLTLLIWRFHKKLIISYAFFAFLYVGVILIKMYDHSTLLDREIVQTICFALITCGLIFILSYISHILSSPFLKRGCQINAMILAFLSLLYPLIVFGFFFTSGGHMLSHDIILTLFQTNFSEIRAFLVDQNFYMFGFVFVCLMALIIKLLQHIKQTMSALPPPPPSFSGSLIFWKNLLFLLSGYTVVSVLPRLNYCFVLSISFNIYQTLQSFHQFQQAQEQRAENLDDLKSMFKNNASNDGVYVLVIGESTTRDRMHAYGYERENTPWLSAMTQQPTTLLFHNAYSNHTHTVPALEYALTGLNQYQNISVQKVFSLPEIANAAGFETYWLSNQKQFPSSVIPIATIAALTKHQTWLNYLGDRRESSSYYDEKLVDFIPWQNIPSKVLIFVHLMGCHVAYNERYPSEFSFFKGADQDQNEYDNAVLYNDHVLKTLYDQVKNLPNFQAFIYFSDHGEELKDKARHDASKFTFAMTHIPLVMIFSDEFTHQRPEIFKTLQKHTSLYITNDLVYNFMLGILGIQGLPNQNESLDISSAQYHMTKNDLLTLHGQKRISGDY